MTTQEMEDALKARTTRDLKCLRRGIEVLPDQYVKETGLYIVRTLVECILEERSRRPA
jgi:hypothetical protein